MRTSYIRAGRIAIATHNTADDIVKDQYISIQNFTDIEYYHARDFNLPESIYNGVIL